MAIATVKPARFTFCLLLLLTTATCQVRFSSVVEDPHLYPYQARLEMDYTISEMDYKYGIKPRTYECGAVIAGRRFVLTAAHCVKRERLDTSYVHERTYVLKVTHIFLGSLGSDPNDVWKHFLVTDRDAYAFNDQYREAEPDPDKRAINNDIALIRTPEPIVIHAVRVTPAVLGNPLSRVGTGWQCAISGWGQATMDHILNNLSSDELRHAKIKVLSPDKCWFFSKYGVDGHIRREIDSEICIEGEYKRRRTFAQGFNVHHLNLKHPVMREMAPATMNGDSGGPLSCHPRSRHFYEGQHMSVYGLTAHGNRYWAGHRFLYSHFTRIAAHIGWIQERFEQHNAAMRNLPANDEARANHIDEVVLLDGRHATMGQFPYQVATLSEELVAYCSGAILNKWWVVSVLGCLEINKTISAGLTDAYFDVSNEYQERTCIRVEAQQNVELCKVNEQYRFHGDFVQPIQLFPLFSNENPRECAASSWEYPDNAPQLPVSNSLTYKEVQFNQFGEPLEVEENNRFDATVRTGPGAPLVCTARLRPEQKEGRYLVGIKVVRRNGGRLESAGYLNVRRHNLWVRGIIST